MRILGLDLSTHMGEAVLEDGNLIHYDTKHAGDVTVPDSLVNDYYLVQVARRMARLSEEVIEKFSPDLIYIEQTNAGRFRGAQKQLEFIHFAVLDKISEMNMAQKVRYIDTSRWRSILSVKLSKEQRVHNKAVKAKTIRGKITPKHLAVDYVNRKFNLALKLKDNDTADAICIADAGTLQMRSASTIKPDSRSLEDVLSGTASQK